MHEFLSYLDHKLFIIGGKIIPYLGVKRIAHAQVIDRIGTKVVYENDKINQVKEILYKIRDEAAQEEFEPDTTLSIETSDVERLAEEALTIINR